MSSSGRILRDHALVAVASGHLVADREVALGRDVDLDHLEHAGRQLVAAREPVDDLVLLGLVVVDAVVVLCDEPSAFSRFAGRAAPRTAGGPDRRAGDRERRRVVERTSFAELFGRSRSVDGARPGPPSGRRMTCSMSSCIALAGSRSRVLRIFDELLLRSSSVRLTLRRELLRADHDALDARRHLERVVLHVLAGAAEDRVQQLLFGRQLALALRRDLADQDVARLDARADADDAVLVEVRERPLARRSGCRG